MSAFGVKADIPGALILACLGSNSTCNPVAHVSGANLLPPDDALEIACLATNALNMVSLAEATTIPATNLENYWAMGGGGNGKSNGGFKDHYSIKNGNASPEKKGF